MAALKYVVVFSFVQSLAPDDLELIVEFLRKRLRKVSHSSDWLWYDNDDVIVQSAKGKGESHSFNLEVVGQYLMDEDLVYVEVLELVIWWWEKPFSDYSIWHSV